ncbi:hypothetical protein LTR95_016311 [Oleoguttula sp. CCFEE 5521]
MDTTQLIEAITQCNLDVSNGVPGAREKLLPLSYQLSASVETPTQMIWNTFSTSPLRAATVRTAIDLDIFETLKAANGRSSSILELANPRNASPDLVRRIVAFLASVDIILETGVDAFSATRISNALTTPGIHGGAIYGHDIMARSMWEIPSYLAKRSYQNPSNPLDAPLQDAFNTKEHFFPYVSANPLLVKSFNDFMGVYREGKEHWTNFYPLRERLQRGTDISIGAIALVDVGGGLGHDLAAVLSQHPDLSGQLVVQDRKEVIDSIEPSKLDPGIQREAHDFFTPQPRKARLFYLHSVLHDWDDKNCTLILQNVAKGMDMDSRIAINDLLVPDSGSSRSLTSMDLGMMALGSATERTESQWRKLVEAASLRVTEVFRPFDPSSECVVEVALPL